MHQIWNGLSDMDMCRYESTGRSQQIDRNGPLSEKVAIKKQRTPKVKICV